MLTHELLTDLLDYDEVSGIFRWKICKRPQAQPGDVAGWWCKSAECFKIEISGKTYVAHRLAWFYIYKAWPSKQIDHKDGNRRNNRILNLREADNSQNQANMPAKSNSRTGLRGVGFSRNRYLVQLCKSCDGRKIKIRRSFDNLEDAKDFAAAQSKVLHGDFSYHSRSDSNSQV